MLKPLLLGIITLSSSIFLTASSARTSTIHSVPVIDRPSTAIASSQSSDLKKIHQVLTRFYRGLNQSNIKLMSTVLVGSSKNKLDLQTLQQQFDQAKANNVEISTEVKDIELTELSNESALIKINQIVKFTGPQKSAIYQQVALFKLVKNNGEWKIFGGEALKPSTEISIK